MINLFNKWATRGRKVQSVTVLPDAITMEEVELYPDGNIKRAKYRTPDDVTRMIKALDEMSEHERASQYWGFAIVNMGEHNE